MTLPVDFPYESETQRKSCGTFDLWLRRLPFSVLAQSNDTDLMFAFMTQKIHESNEWWAKTVGDQFKSLENQIMEIKK